MSLLSTGHCQRLSWEVSLRGVFAKCDTIVCRHCRSLPSPEVGCQCKCHIDLTFTSLESGKGLAFSYLISGTSNWANLDFQTEKFSQEVILDALEAAITTCSGRINLQASG